MPPRQRRATLTERSFYEALISVIHARGGKGVQEVQFNSVPDIAFELGHKHWLLSVKIGTDSRTIKDAFLQYLRHKDESGIKLGLVLFLPEQVRRIPAEHDALHEAVASLPVTALIDADLVKDELRDRPFPAVIDFLGADVLPRLSRKVSTSYPLARVIDLLKQHVQDMMAETDLEERALLKIIVDRRLLTGLAHLERRDADATARFLASYIFLSQVLFLRLLSSAHPSLAITVSPVTHTVLRRAFRKVLDINYKPIYEVDVLDSISDEYLRDTFQLIWGLAVERVRYELPGRIFHELMPPEIRKLLAAFYTRPLAADLLAALTVPDAVATVLDPACGSGTILVSAYRRKLELYRGAHPSGEPHKRFCEDDIFGCDIMPFAVHLASANLAAMNPAVIIDRTQIIQGDSITLESQRYHAGIQTTFFPQTAVAETVKGETYDVDLRPVECVLMNPPFTKVERGISRYVNMNRFQPVVGGEVGLWGHFLGLADSLLKEDGLCGAVIPINVLRGRESRRVRDLVFRKWATHYVLKPTMNYAFSEWSEYRDVLLIASKRPSKPDTKVKFCLVRRDLTRITPDEVKRIADTVRRESRLRGDELVDVDTHTVGALRERFDNLMWFCGTTSLSHRDLIVSFCERFAGKLTQFPEGYFREGYRPVPKGVSDFLFATRASAPARIERAFLRFEREGGEDLSVTSELGVRYTLRKDEITPSLRTTVGLTQMDVSNDLDYIATRQYGELSRVCRAAGRTRPKGEFWLRMRRELEAVKTQIVVSHRINPYSPATHLNAFFSEGPYSPSNQVNVIVENNPETAKAVCVLLNSILFFAPFFLIKEESTGRFINVRFYDLHQLVLYPAGAVVGPLAQVFQRFRGVRFPALREQFDAEFEARYDAFWEAHRTGQIGLFDKIRAEVRPSEDRLKFDVAVCEALGAPVTHDDLKSIYGTLVTEMIVTRGLQRD